MPDKRTLMSLTLAELRETLKDQPGYRAKQVYEWLLKGTTFEGMRNLPIKLRDELAGSFVDQPLTLLQDYPSQKDDTVKFLFSCLDGNLIEGVLMHYHYGYSLCVSTQVGCKMGCAFCASTLDGCVRNLEAGEILAQVVLANTYLGEKGHVGHVVMMGSGEPLDNYDESVRFLRLLNAPEGLNISLRNVSLSTCGLAPRIRELAGEGLPVTLSVSLHAPNDELRRQIMPIALAYPIQELMAAAREYVRLTGRRVVFEYALIDKLNSRPEQAEELARLLAGLQCHVNLIPLNHVEERKLLPASPEAVKAFLAKLEALHVSATVRREMGTDIAGACGQLRRSRLQSKQ